MKIKSIETFTNEFICFVRVRTDDGRAIPNAGKYLEFSIEGLDYYPWQDELFVEPPFTPVGGKVTVTDAPGWGVAVNPDWLAKSAYRVSVSD